MSTFSMQGVIVTLGSNVEKTEVVSGLVKLAFWWGRQAFASVCANDDFTTVPMEMPGVTSHPHGAGGLCSPGRLGKLL